MAKKNALALYKKNPRGFISALLPRERALIGILGKKAAPMPIEQIRGIYIRNAFENITDSLKLVRYGKVALERYVGALGPKEWNGELDKIRAVSFSFSGPCIEETKALASVFFPEGKQINLLMNHITASRIMTKLQDTYSNLIEIRPYGARIHYYLNEDFAALWQENAKKTVEKAKANPAGVGIYKYEIEFYAIAKELTQTRLDNLDAKIKASSSEKAKPSTNYRVVDWWELMGMPSSAPAPPNAFMPLIVPMDGEVRKFLDSALGAASWETVIKATEMAEKTTTEEQLKWVEKMLPKGYKVVKE